jgi:hypothetical protein
MLCLREQVVPGRISLRPPLGGMENHSTAVWGNRVRLERVSDVSGKRGKTPGTQLQHDAIV